jgi:hypothetical protein
MNICGKNRHLRQARNRYHSWERTGISVDKFSFRQIILYLRHMRTIAKIIFIFSLVFALTSCKKEAAGECYDKKFHEAHKNDFCTYDCPGVIGCDGKSYCNECIMHTNGIKKTK